MKLHRTLVLGASALALALGTANAADDKNAAADAPGFNQLDKDDDGALSRTEAAGNPALAARFAEVDADQDGKISRAEYLKTMAVKDIGTLREKAADVIDPDDKPKSSTGGSTR